MATIKAQGTVSFGIRYEHDDIKTYDVELDQLDNDTLLLLVVRGLRHMMIDATVQARSAKSRSECAEQRLAEIINNQIGRHK